MNKQSYLNNIQDILKDTHKDVYKIRALNWLVDMIHNSNSGLDIFDSLELIATIRNLKSDLVSKRV